MFNVTSLGSGLTTVGQVEALLSKLSSIQFWNVWGQEARSHVKDGIVCIFSAFFFLVTLSDENSFNVYCLKS